MEAGLTLPSFAYSSAFAFGIVGYFELLDFKFWISDFILILFLGGGEGPVVGFQTVGEQDVGKDEKSRGL